jgi:RecB family endonuclease NucS
VLRLDRSQRTLRRLETRKLQLAGLLERSDLQRMIVTAPGAFCAEIAEELLFLGEEVTPTDVVSDRIDILAMDRQGAVVVVELKRGANKLQLLQALSYAAMISEWETEGIVSPSTP